MNPYLSVDTEATGLQQDSYLIQLAFVPVDPGAGKVFVHLGKELLIKCPPFEELEPRLDAWNISHNKELIIHANRSGVEPKDLPRIVTEYLDSPDIQAIFGGKRPVLLGKSLSALDIPILRRYLGWEFYEKRFHHHTVDVTCVARAFVDSGLLPPGCESTTQLVRHFGIREEAKHTALSDALDMGDIYLKLVNIGRAAKQQPS